MNEVYIVVVMLIQRMGFKKPIWFKKTWHLNLKEKQSVSYINISLSN